MGISECNRILESPVKLVISLTQSRYTAGDEVKGEIFIKIFETFGCTKLKLISRFEQYTQYLGEDRKSIPLFNIHKCKRINKNNSDTGKKLHPFKDISLSENISLNYPMTENKIIHNLEIFISKFHKYRLLPGEYKYPFSFILPENIPGSFEYCDNNYYIFSRCILEAGIYTASLKNTIRAIFLIIVNQPVKFLQVIYEKIDVRNFKKLILINKGSAVLKVTILKESFLFSDTIIANCELDNRKCSLNANLIKVSLIQNIKLKFKQKITKIITRIVTSMNYPYTIYKKKLSNFTLELPILDFSNPTRYYYENCKNFLCCKLL